MSDFMGIVEMIDAQLLRRHNNTATEFFEIGQQAERERIMKILEEEQKRTGLGFIQYKVLIEKIQNLKGEVDAQRQTQEDPHPPKRFRDIANGE